jgi:hypothetical protein
MGTMDILTLLKELGLDPACGEAQRSIGLVRKHVTWWQLDGRPFFDGETEPCINGRILGAGACFGCPSGRLLERILGEQLEDGGWNCEAPKSRRSSFHSTICVLEGLLEYELAVGPDDIVTHARQRAHEYLLARRMFRCLSSGEVIDQKWTRFSFPTFWHYDILRGLDYFWAAGSLGDDRLSDGFEVVVRKRRKDGRWPLQQRWAGETWFEMEKVGEPSRWNTLRAMRVLEAGKGRLADRI